MRHDVPSTAASRSPVALSPFIGRDAELAEIRALLAEERLLTLSGPGGSGKSRLAVEAVRGAGSAPIASTHFVELAPLASGRFVGAAVLGAIGLVDHPSRDVVATMATHLTEGSCLVVLDNCEHVIGTVAELAVELLDACPSMSILATTREPLAVTGERVFRVGALAVPAADGASDREAVGNHDGVQLFVDRAMRVRQGFALTDANAAAVGAIVRRLDGMPLALELAAAQLRWLSVEAVEQGLADRFGLLDDGPRTAESRHRSLSASVDWSYDLLTTTEQAVLHGLSVFAGGFTLDAAERVVADADGRFDVRAGLVGLVDKSLVQADPTSADSRYTLLETIRQYARHRLEESGNASTLRDRHLAWVVDLAAAAEPQLTGAHQAAWLDRLELELGNVREAMTWADRQDRHDDRLRVATDLTFFWKLHGHLREGREHLDAALRSREAGSDASLVHRARCSCADLSLWSGDYAATLDHAEAALQGALAVGDPRTVARATWAIGNAEYFTLGPNACGVRDEEAVELARQAGDEWCYGVSLQLVILRGIDLGDDSRSWDLVGEAERVATSTGCPQLVAWNCVIRCYQSLYGGDYDACDEWYRAGMGSAGQLTDPATTSVLGVIEAEALVQRGRGREAIELLEGLDVDLDRRGALQFRPLVNFFLLFASIGDGSDRAMRALHAIDEDPAAATPFWRALATTGRALLALDDPDVEVRRAASASAVAEARRLGKVWLLAGILIVDGLLHLDVDLSRAEHELHEALTIGVDCHLPSRVADAIDCLAVSVAVFRAHPANGARLAGAADAVRAASGLPVERYAHVAGLVEAVVVEQLGDDGYRAAYEEGARMSAADAVTYARGTRGTRSRPPSGWDSLTPAEQRVVALAVDGLTNPQIAERLFVSRGTVKTHLAHIYDKLGVGNRTQLAAAAAGRPRR